MARAALLLLLLGAACTHRRAAALLECPRSGVAAVEEQSYSEGLAAPNAFTGSNVNALEPFHAGWTRYAGCGREALCFDDPGAVTAPADRCLVVAAAIPEMIAHSARAEGHRLGCAEPVVPLAFGTHWTLGGCGRALVCIGAQETKFHAVGSDDQSAGYVCELAPLETPLGVAFRAHHRTFTQTYMLLTARLAGDPTAPRAGDDMATLTLALARQEPAAPSHLLAFHERHRGWRRFVEEKDTAEARSLFARWLFLRRLNDRALVEARAAQLRGNIPGMHLLIGHILADEGRLDEAEAALRADGTPDGLAAIAQLRPAGPPSTSP